MTKDSIRIFERENRIKILKLHLIELDEVEDLTYRSFLMTFLLKI